MTHVKASDKIPRKNGKQTDFSKVGGLSNHLKILRDTIIVPLLHNNVYSHFNIKTPRGILFYGPPGTGKTLVAGALATEINREGFGKVTFYQRKGADVLDKWVGESEKKLRTLFDNATKTRPSIIFFDEVDGLAPIRSAKNDHVHCSIVTTLLALMDGLDSVPGVIVIGATNRIESVDPALRRTGRFDRELYFPLPSTEARKEILQVHMQTWRPKPSNLFIAHLAEITTGFCGSDLQALCGETLLCSMKRNYPNIQKCLLGNRVKIEADEIKIDECDFLEARKNLIPSSQKLGNRMRKLSAVVAPLLQRQLDAMLHRLQMLWPHFFVQFYKYLLGNERYVGRVVLMGSNLQGVTAHLVPAILQKLEHLPAMFLDASIVQNKNLLLNFCQNLPSILVIPRVDELWNFLEVPEQSYFAALLDDIHAGLPILVVATCDEEIPIMLQHFFYNNTSLILPVDNPTEPEIEDFLAPLFFGDAAHSLNSVLAASRTEHTRRAPRPSQGSAKVYNLKAAGKVTKPAAAAAACRLHKTTLARAVKMMPPEGDYGDGGWDNSLRDEISAGATSRSFGESTSSLCSFCNDKKRLSLVLSDLLKRCTRVWRSPAVGRHGKAQSFGDSNDIDEQKIFNLWRRAVVSTAKEMPVAHLEVLYDTVAACISIHKDDFPSLTKSLEEALSEIELSK